MAKNTVASLALVCLLVSATIGTHLDGPVSPITLHVGHTKLPVVLLAFAVLTEARPGNPNGKPNKGGGGKVKPCRANLSVIQEFAAMSNELLRVVKLKKQLEGKERAIIVFAPTGKPTVCLAFCCRFAPGASMEKRQ
jgi:hypothetical protein